VSKKVLPAFNKIGASFSRVSPRFWQSLALLSATAAVLLTAMAIHPILYLLALPLVMLFFVFLERREPRTPTR